MDRRHFLIGSGALVAAPSAWSAPSARLADAIRQLEQRSGGRLGVAMLDTGSGRRFSWRGDALFPLCSTFKFLLAGALLVAAEKKRIRLDRRIPVERGDLLPISPYTETRVGRGAAIVELMRATIVDSDNAAANLLLPLIDGPAGLTRFAREIGDRVTRLDRSEPELGEAAPGDPRDTTSPEAMAADMAALLTGPLLAPASRRRLTEWMIACRTGKARLRAGLPAGWRAGDKTGSGGNGTCNDIAIAWRPGQQRPVLIAAYLTGATVSPALRESILASVGHVLAAAGRSEFSPAGAARPRS
jgi:beta-lactamase class A